jgi:hypothetical protein
VNFSIVRTRRTCQAIPDNLVVAMLAWRYSFNLGLVVHTWGLRLMLGWWHLCWHWERKAAA